MYLVIEENPNCGPEERVFSTSGKGRPVLQVEIDRPGAASWEASAVDENGVFRPVEAFMVEDSGAGVAWLVRGGDWGVRLRPADRPSPWSLEDKSQWGAPFLVLDESAVRFED